MTKQAALRKAKTLQALAQCGETDHERSTAAFVLEKLMHSCGITSEEVEGYTIKEPPKPAQSAIAQRLRQIRSTLNTQKRRMHMGVNAYKNADWAVKLADIEILLDALILEMELNYKRLPSQSGQKRAPTKTAWKKGDLEKMQRKYL